MDRRFLTVLGASLVFALVVSSIFYQMSSSGAGPAAPSERTDVVDVVVAAKPIGVGVNIKPDDVKVVKLPNSAFPKGGFSKVEEVIDRPVVNNILMDEPVLGGRLAPRGSGFGLAPVIPVGMRAVSVRVNDVVGVAGFVLPGMHVDVLITGRPPDGGENTMTTTVLQDITVLSAGQNLQADSAGQAINTPVVTLLVTPEQAEVLTLAGNETKIQLVLRNGADKDVAKTGGRKLAELYRKGGKPAAEESERPRPRVLQTAQSPLPPAPVAMAPPPPPPDQIIVIRGTQKTVEVVAGSRGSVERN
jgi:pilus assembly protein CpaB